jgi:hypothetical protein
MRITWAMIGLAAMAFATVSGAGSAQAQSSTCERLGPLMQQRASLMQRINGMGKRRIDPNVACRLFGSLAANGSQTIAFVDENKDWCQIPDDFVANLKESQKQIANVRGQACRAAQQQAVVRQRLQQQQRQAQQQGGAGAFGGVDGFSGGPWRVPQGAL